MGNKSKTVVNVYTIKICDNLPFEDLTSKDISILKKFKISMFIYDVINVLMNINEAVKSPLFFVEISKISNRNFSENV